MVGFLIGVFAQKMFKNIELLGNETSKKKIRTYPYMGGFNI